MVLEKKRTIGMLSTRRKNNTGRKDSKSSQLVAKKKMLRLGDICNLKITALAPNNIGIDEYSFPYVVFVPNAKLGSQIKAKILKIQESSYAVGQIIEEKMSSLSQDVLNQIPVKPGDVLTVSIKKQMEKGKAGIVELAKNFHLIVPLSNVNLEDKKGLDNVKVTVTRVKFNYGFAKIENLASFGARERQSSLMKSSISHENGDSMSKVLKPSGLEVGCKFTTTIPATAFSELTTLPLPKAAKQDNTHQVVSALPSNGAVFSKSNVALSSSGKRKFVVLNVNGSILFLKLKKGRMMAEKLKNLFGAEQNGDKNNNRGESLLRVRIKITSKSTNCAVGKILHVKAMLSRGNVAKLALPPSGVGDFVSEPKRLAVFGVNPATSLQQKQPALLYSAKDRTIAALSSLLPSVAFGSSSLQVGGTATAFSGQSYASGEGQSSPNFAIEGQNREYEKKKKTALVLNSIRDMIYHGMHFGEKAVKCHARMKNYVWNVRSRSNSSPLKGKGGVSNKLRTDFALQTYSPSLSVSERPLIKKGRHVINLLKTRRCLNQALNKLTKYALKGRTFLFIGTKKPAAGLVARASFFTKNSFYVNTRWLGGMLTNWKTICKSISKIRPILKEKQKVVRDILEKRQAIKNRLIKKAFLLKKKSKLILNKGRLLLETLKKDKTVRLNNAKKLTTLRNDFIHKGLQYLEKRQKLIQKRRELIYQTLLLKEKGLDLSFKHKAVLNQLAIYAKKLREYKYLLILTSEIQNLKTVTATSLLGSETKSPSVAGSNALLSVSYGKLKQVISSFSLDTTSSKQETNKENKNQAISWILPNPPKEILNRIVLTYLQLAQANGSHKQELGLEFEQNNKKYTNLTDSLITGKSTGGDEANAMQHKKQFIVCSTLLSKFSSFSSYIKSVIKTLITSIQSLEAQAKTYSTQLNEIKKTLQTYLSLKQKYVAELQLLKVKFTKERSIIRSVKSKLKALDAQKKLLKFLPRLRYLPTPQTKISEIVQILLARIVDPKLKYPIENIYDQKLSTSSKKLAVARKKKWQRLEKYFGGIANMTKLSQTQISRNVAIIIGQKEEINAVHECKKLGIKLFTIVDTNCNPTLSDHIIPANDDSRSSIKYILTKFITRIRLAQKLRSRLSIYMK